MKDENKNAILKFPLVARKIILGVFSHLFLADEI